MYGMIPKARIEACENAPPANVSKRPNKPFLPEFDLALSNKVGSIPGKTMCVPNL